MWTIVRKLLETKFMDKYGYLLHWDQQKPPGVFFARHHHRFDPNGPHLSDIQVQICEGQVPNIEDLVGSQLMPVATCQNLP